MQAGDLLVIDHEAMQLDPARNYDRWLSRPHRILNRSLDDPLADILPIHKRSPWVWLLYRTGDRISVMKHTAGLERVLCEVVYDERGFTLERHALPGLACPNAPIRLAFGRGALRWRNLTSQWWTAACAWTCCCAAKTRRRPCTIPSRCT